MREHWNGSWTSGDDRVEMPQGVSHLGELSCPACGGDNLHHHQVVVAERKTEDREGRVVRLGHGMPEIEHAEADSPRFAGRRDHLAIQFSCETCPAQPWLLLVQHKGTTYMGWCDPRSREHA